jgi:WD40 repeat protein
MNQLKLSVGVLLLLGSLALAANFSACSKSSGGGGTAGATGTAGAGTAGGGLSPTLASGKCVPGAFPHGTPPVCACQPDTPTVCSTPALGCTTTTIDDANCGMCGNACAATSTCNTSVCGPTAKNVLPAIAGCTLPATSDGIAMNITVSGGKVYYTDTLHGTIGSVPVGGGAATPVVMGEMAPGQIAITGSTALWISVTSATSVMGDGGVTITTTTAKLRKAPLPTGPAVDLVTETNTNGGIRGFTVSPDGATVYYSADTNVKSIPLAGATAGTIVAMEQQNGVPAALGLSEDGKTIAYVTDGNGDVDVVTLGTSPASTNGNNCPANTACCGMHPLTDPNGETLLMTNCTRVARSQGSPYFGAIILKNGSAYWGDDTAIHANPATPGAAQSNAQVSTTNMGPVTAFGGTATHIYFGDALNQLLFKDDYSLPPTDGGQKPDAIRIARGQVVTSLAFDAANVYWSTADCAINSVPQ